MVTMTNTQKRTFGPVLAFDKLGKPSAIDGAPKWSTTDPGVLVLDIAPDGLSAVGKAVANGTAQVRAEGDANLGDGVQIIVGVVDVQVVASQAVTLDIPVGPATEQ